MKRMILILVASLSLVGMAVTAAAEPMRTPVPSPGDFVTVGCGFPVAGHFPVWDVMATTFDNGQGAIERIESGAATVQLTNPQTEEVVELNISGPLTLRVFSDGSSIRQLVGPWFFRDFPPGQGVPSMFVTEGRITIRTDAHGNVSVERSGRLIDLCAELAP